jgi:hypothetical protein
VMAGAGLEHALNLDRLVISIVNGRVTSLSRDSSISKPGEGQGKNSMGGNTHYAGSWSGRQQAESSTPDPSRDSTGRRSPGA